MCPLCIGTTALLVSGGTSAGGLTALLLMRRARGQGTRLIGRLRELGRHSFQRCWALARPVPRATAMHAEQ